MLETNSSFPIKILVSSAADKVALIKSVAEAARQFNSLSKVVAGDSRGDVLSQFVADEFWLMPLINEDNLNSIVEGCRCHGVNVVLPTRDGELYFWAKHKEIFESHGIGVVVSPYESLALCFDKLNFSKFGKLNELPVIISSEKIDEIISHKYVVKERFGSGSKGMGINLTKDEALRHAKKLTDPIYQKFIFGREFSADVWVNKNHIVKGVVLRWRNLVINGESKVTTTFRNQIIEKQIKEVAGLLKLSGPVVLQGIIDESGHLNIIECNARFGGASTASIKVGLNSIFWSLQEFYSGDAFDCTFSRLDGEIRQIRLTEDYYDFCTNL